jgi:hypothetical protein
MEVRKHGEDAPALGDHERLCDAALGVAHCHRRRPEIEGPQQRRDELANAASSSTTGTLHGTS